VRRGETGMDGPRSHFCRTGVHRGKAAGTIKRS
jgi:hypothetical protein